MRYHLNNLIFPLSLILALSTPGLARDEIRVRAEALINSPRVLLQDVAEIRATGTEPAKLKNLVVADMRERRVNQVSIFEISRALAQAHIEPASVILFGANNCALRLAPELQRQLELKSQLPGEKQKSQINNQNRRDDAATALTAKEDVVSGPTLADELRILVGRNAGLDPNQIILDVPAQGLLLQQAAGRYAIKPLGHAGLGLVAFELAEPNNGRRTRLSGTALFKCTAVAARRALGAGAIIKAEDVELIPQRVSSLREAGIADPEAVVGQATRRPIAAHQVIETALLRKLILVKQREIVEITKQAPGVEITLRGIALTDGGLGDTVTVKTGISGKMDKKQAQNEAILTGVVTGPGKIRIGEKPMVPDFPKVAQNELNFTPGGALMAQGY